MSPARTYSDLRVSLATLIYPFPKQKKKYLAACCYREDNPNRMTLTGYRIRESCVSGESVANFKGKSALC